MIVSEQAGDCAVDGAAVWRRVHRRLLPPLFLISLLCQLDRANLAFAALQMDGDLGFSRTVHGAGSGLFFIGYLAQIPANMLCVLLGPQRWLPILLASWGLVAMSFAAVRGVASFLLLRLLLGVAEAGAYPAIMYLLSLFYPPRSLGLAYTTVATATAVAGLAGAPLAAALMLLDGRGGLSGWRWLFLVEGLLPILLAAALPWLLPASPLAARFLAPAEQQWLMHQVQLGSAGGDIELVSPSAADATGSPPAQQQATNLETASLLSPDPAAQHARAGEEGADEERCAKLQHDGGLSSKQLRRGLLDSRIWHLAVVMLLIDACMNSANFWVPSLVKAALRGELRSDDGGTEDGDEASGSSALLIKSALLSALPFCGAAVCMVANAWHAKCSDERRLHTAVPMLFAGLGLAAVPLVAPAGPALALVALTVAASGIWATHGPFFSWPSAFLDHKSAAIGFALVKTGGAVGGFAGPFVVGALADAFHGFTVSMLLLAGVAAAAAGLVLLFNDQRRFV